MAPNFRSERHPFVPRVYQRNVDLENRLVGPCIADMNRRQGVVDRLWSLSDEREPDYRSDFYELDRLGKQISQHRLRSQMEEHAREHDRIIRSALNAADFQRIQLMDGPFCRRFMPMEAIRAQSNHAAHVKLMETRRLQDVHDEWEAIKDDERRMRARKLFRPLEVVAIPEVPYHRAYRKPSLYDF